jgi:hypothetical protein
MASVGHPDVNASQIHLNDLVPILQAAVSPVVLISGVGLLILSMTNRLARVVDRSRLLGAMRRGPVPEDRGRADSQLRILVRRARLLRRAIRFSVLCVLTAAILVIELFLSAYLQFDAVLPGVVLFVFCLASLIVALLSFLQDINLSLVALDLELGLDDKKA